MRTIKFKIEPSNNELMHWKYIKRERKNGKWVYTYDYESVKKDVKKVVNKAKTSVDKTVEAVKKTVHKYIAKVPTDGDTYRYFYSEEAYRAYTRGKTTVDNLMKKQLNVTPKEVTKANIKSFLSNTIFGGFGEAVYKVVAPALVALQVELTTPKSFSELKKTKTKQTSDEHQLAINSEYDPTKYDYAMNCSFCTAAYDLRKRGYDVEANPISQAEAYTLEDICSWYEGAKPSYKYEVESEYTNTNTFLTEGEKLIDNLKKQGDGARGHLCLYFPDGTGHDVVWEVENGEVLYRDCQTGTISRTFSELSYAYDYAYVRTDNLEPTEAVLRTVRNRKTR